MLEIIEGKTINDNINVLINYFIEKILINISPTILYSDV